MPLSASAMSAAIRAAFLAHPDTGAVDDDSLTQFCDAIAGAVVTSITTTAVVVPTALVAPPGGGPVTGVGTIT